MKNRILILTNPEDFHSFVIAKAIRQKGGDVTLWFTSDYPTRSAETILYEKNSRKIMIRGSQVFEELPDFGVVWNRRPSMLFDETRVDPDDKNFAYQQCVALRRSMLAVLSTKSFWVNPPWTSKSHIKPYQQQLATEIGLEMPASIYSNDPEEIRKFIARHNGRIVYKCLEGGGYWDEEGKSLALFTNTISEQDLVDDQLLEACPGIYQELIPKSYELRITVMGNRVYPAKIHSQVSRKGKLDWRRAYDELAMEPCEIPIQVEQKILKLMERLEIVFGCADFIATPDGRYVFLEVNQMGQFLWVETMAGIPLVNDFAEFLLQGKADFSPHGNISYKQVAEEARRDMEDARREHLSPKIEVYNESAK